MDKRSSEYKNDRVYKVKKIVAEWANAFRHKIYYYVQLVNGDFTVTDHITQTGNVPCDNCWGFYKKKDKHKLDQKWVETKVRESELAIRRG